MGHIKTKTHLKKEKKMEIDGNKSNYVEEFFVVTE